MNKVILFGAGGFLDNVIGEATKLPETVYLWVCDNDPQKEGTTKHGLEIKAPSSLENAEYDYVVIASIHANCIRQQLIDLKIPCDKIKNYVEYAGMCLKGQYRVYLSEAEQQSPAAGKSVLMITSFLSFAGGSWAAVYALMALREKGYGVNLAAPGGDEEFIRTAYGLGMSVWIYPNITFERLDEMNWLPQVDYVIVNTYQMHDCLINLQFHKKVLWWLHEAEMYYEGDIGQYGRTADAIFDNTEIYAVSEYAKNAFLSFYPGRAVGIMEYGIPDEGTKRVGYGEKLTFALVGTICPRKGQDILIEAVSLLPQNIKEICRFWIVGSVDDEDFYKRVRENSKSEPGITFFDGMSHEQLMSFYKKIDVLISASRQDPLPIVVTEAMMHRKLCLVADCIGTMRYVSEGDVMSFRSGSSKDLSEKIEYIAKKRDILDEFGERARAVFERQFSLESFGDRIEKALTGIREEE